MERKNKRMESKGYKEMVGGRGCIQYLNYGDAFMGGYICQNLSSGVL